MKFNKQSEQNKLSELSDIIKSTNTSSALYDIFLDENKSLNFNIPICNINPDNIVINIYEETNSIEIRINDVDNIDKYNKQKNKSKNTNRAYIYNGLTVNDNMFIYMWGINKNYNVSNTISTIKDGILNINILKSDKKSLSMNYSYNFIKK